MSNDYPDGKRTIRSMRRKGELPGGPSNPLDAAGEGLKDSPVVKAVGSAVKKVKSLKDKLF